jgi:type IV pilus assembly protein PilE
MKRLPSRGFTLIELMITVAVVAILASVAYPSYIQYIVRTHRSAVQSQMYAVANKQEQYLLDQRSYASTLAALNMALPAEVASRYTVTVAADMTTTPPSYLVTATPIGAQLNDTRCGTLTLNHLGVKTQSGTAASVADCW